jgi:putative ABC transport system substrate-binding protein
MLIIGFNAAASYYFRAFGAAAASLGVKPLIVRVQQRAEIAQTIMEFAQGPNGGLLLPPDNFTTANRDLVVDLAAKHRLPAVYATRSIAVAGGLLSYGIDPHESVRGAAAYVDRILRGEKAGDLPIQQPTKFEFVLNLKTAKALGLTVPLTLQASADEVIE